MAPASEGDFGCHGHLSEGSSGKLFGEVIRDYEAPPDVHWRVGTPNYACVNRLYFEHRVKVHPQGTLEAVVSKLIKNWEVESHHVADPTQWKTMNIAKFQAAVNGGNPSNAHVLADIGRYNVLLGETPEYSARKQTFHSSNNIFRSTFTEGFAFEVLEVLSGPPSITFKWRHFGKFSGTFVDARGGKHVGTNAMINLIGMCIAKVSDVWVLESLDVYYNAEDLLKPLVKTKAPREAEVPVGGDESDPKNIASGPWCTVDGGSPQQSGCAVT